MTRNKRFKSEAAVEAYLDKLPHGAYGTYKANTSCVQIDADTSDVILCDAGTGLRDYSLTIPTDGQPRTYHIFISHLHWDHIQGFPFFAPAYVPGNRIIFHGFQSITEQTIRNQMNAPCFPVPFEAMQADIEFDIREEGSTFDVEDVHVRTIHQQHPGGSWGYRFEKLGKAIVYSSDSEHGVEAQQADYPFIEFFKSADVLIFDGQYTFNEAQNAKRNWGHSDQMTGVELAARAEVKQLVITHHEPAYSDDAIEAISKEASEHRIQYNATIRPNASEIYPQTVTLAYDGLTLDTELAHTVHHMTDSPAPTKGITKAEINDLPLISWEGPIKLLETEEAMIEAVEQLKNETHLGFDTETRPTFKKGEYYPPALIQLGTADCVYLFRINKIKTFKPLLPILESPDILKTGVAIKDDVKELRAMEEFEPAGFVEVADLTQKLGYSNRGLRPLAALLLGGRISKAAQVSNWAKQELDDKQIRYAATDAWISRDIYVKACEEQSPSN